MLSAMDEFDRRLIVLAAAWGGYFTTHSWLASLNVKRWIASHWQDLLPAYRLLYNGIASILLLPLSYMTFQFRGPTLWAWSGVSGWLANGLALMAVLGFFWTLRFYDSGEFIGLRQWRQRNHRVEDQEQFHLSPLHRFVRHPWYSLGLIILWTRDMDPSFLVAAIAATLYIVIGSRLEEHKMQIYHGAIYREYQALVPGLIPVPWKYLKQNDLRRLNKIAN